MTMSTKQLRGWRSAGRDHTREIVRVERTDVEKLPQDLVDLIHDLDARVRRLEARTAQSQEFVLPQGLKEVMERLTALERRPIDITPAQTDTTIVEQVAALREDVEALQDNRDAHRAMIETAAGFSDIARQIMRDVDENRARANAQFGVAMDHVKELSETIRRAIG